MFSFFNRLALFISILSCLLSCSNYNPTPPKLLKEARADDKNFQTIYSFRQSFDVLNSKISGEGKIMNVGSISVDSTYSLPTDARVFFVPYYFVKAFSLTNKEDFLKAMPSFDGSCDGLSCYRYYTLPSVFFLGNLDTLQDRTVLDIPSEDHRSFMKKGVFDYFFDHANTFSKLAESKFNIICVTQIRNGKMPVVGANASSYEPGSADVDLVLFNMQTKKIVKTITFAIRGSDTVEYYSKVDNSPSQKIISDKQKDALTAAIEIFKIIYEHKIDAAISSLCKIPPQQLITNR